MKIASRTPEGAPNRCPVCGSFIEVEPSDPPGDAPCPNCGHLLWFRWEDDGDSPVVSFLGPVLNAEMLERLLDRAKERPGEPLELDFNNVQHLSSAVFAKLLLLKKLVGGRLVIRRFHPDLREVFRIARLDQIFDLE
jgi:anti-anti-sigma regulatory factor